MNARGSSRAWRTLRAQILKEEPTCRLQLPGCTHIATTVDHIIPRSIRPDLTMHRGNLRGACAHCNYSRGNTHSRNRNHGRHATPKASAALQFFNVSTKENRCDSIS